MQQSFFKIILDAGDITTYRPLSQCIIHEHCVRIWVTFASRWLFTTPHCGKASTAVIARVPVSGCFREVTPWKSDQRLLQVPDPTSRVRYVEKLSYLSLNEAENPNCNRDNSRTTWVKCLQWSLDIYTAYTWDALDAVQRRVSSMENPRLVQLLQKWPCEGGS